MGGVGSGRRRLAGPRYPCGYPKAVNTCPDCGGEKTRRCARCHRCACRQRLKPGERDARGRLRWSGHNACACGRLKRIKSTHCVLCDRASRHNPTGRTCQQCGARFYRRHKESSRDARKYCSKRCYGRARRLRPDGRTRIEAKAEQAVERRLERLVARWSRDLARQARERMLRLKRCERCREPINCTSGRGIRRRFCATCRPSKVPIPLRAHVCPACGDTFMSRNNRAVYCGQRRCRRAFRKYRGFTFSAIALEERNRLAPMLRDMKEAQRRINTGYVRAQ